MQPPCQRGGRLEFFFRHESESPRIGGPGGVGAGKRRGRGGKGVGGEENRPPPALRHGDGPGGVSRGGCAGGGPARPLVAQWTFFTAKRFGLNAPDSDGWLSEVVFFIEKRAGAKGSFDCLVVGLNGLVL